MMKLFMPQQGDQPFSTYGSLAKSGANGAFAPSFVYALGKIEPCCPTLGVENEYTQVMADYATSGLTDQQVRRHVVKNNRYLARKMCWVFHVHGTPTYFLQPSDPCDFNLLMKSYQRDPRSTDIDLVIGVRGPIAPPEMCNGLMIPIVLFDQISSFDHSSFLGAVPRPDRVLRHEFEHTAYEVLDRIVQLSDNAGSTDEHRALNYLAVRCAGIYVKTWRLPGRTCHLVGLRSVPRG